MFLHYNRYCHWVLIRCTHQSVNVLIEHRYILTCHWYIQLLQYIHCTRTLWYPLHKYSIIEQVTLHHHLMTHHQKAWHLKIILCHTNTHPIWYQMYQLTQIQIHVLHIILHRPDLTYKTTSILNKGDVKIVIIINSRVKSVLTLSKSAQILQLRYF